MYICKYQLDIKKIFKFLLYVIDVFSKNAKVLPLKDKKSDTIT